MNKPQAGVRNAAGRPTLADDVLRYWLAAVRLEETLKVRPKARRTKHASSVPRLDFPAFGQEYFKLPLGDEVAALLSGTPAGSLAESEREVCRAFDGELAAFFESFLLAQYRQRPDESELSHLLCFPVVHMPRGELAGLLRCGVRISFSTDGEANVFRPPSRRERERGAYPQPPNEVRVARAPRSEGAWPFFIDTRLLSYPLGLSSDEIDALFDSLRARDEVTEHDMLSLLTHALEHGAEYSSVANTERPIDAAPARDKDSSGLLSRLSLAMQRRLAQGHTRAEVYPVGIVIDGTQAKTTWHLQRELASLLETQDPRTRDPAHCLGAYLTRRRLGADESPQRALFPGPALTAGQRTAAEHFWGSTLTAVQGPPGTGKTTLILHLCAEALVRQVDSLLDNQRMGAELLLITSSNNRAVDNVMEPLNATAGLPLALRVGSRQVCEQTLAGQLRQTGSWLQQATLQPIDARNEALERASAQFLGLRKELEQTLAPRRAARARMAKRAHLRAALAALPALSAAQAGQTRSADALSEDCARALDQTLRKLEKRLTALSELASEKPGLAQVSALARHYARTAKRDLPAFEAALAEAGLSIEVPLPPLATPLKVSAVMESWEEGAELFLERLVPLRERIAQTLLAAEQKQRAQKLETELSALGPEPDGPPPASGGHDEASRALFSAASRVREAWAKVHAAALHEAVGVALSCVEQERSLRPLFRNEPEHAKQLCRLFCVWGSTLLSLGNCLPADDDTVAQLVIDEAGQCHPAHAVSALMRCTSALVIGDVHQLSPVIDLTPDDEARLLRSAGLQTKAEALLPFRTHGDSHVSAQSLADQAVQTRLSLRDHFRCQPEIIAISDALCGYGLQVHTQRAADSGRATLLAHPVSMLDLRGEQERVFGSLQNQLELRETVALLQTLLARGAAPSEIAVITPYRGQLDGLRRSLLELGVPLEFSAELIEARPFARERSMENAGPTHASAGGLALGTVHRFQGGERSIVLFSSVITRSGSLGFLNARPNLLNVAISRARDHFVCLGDHSVLLQGPLTRVLVEAARPL